MTTLPPFIHQLLAPDSYPHPVTLPIQLIQTHVSYVFLTGDYAYKVKKPVNFGFLDYSSLEKRRHFCHEEVRLNRRFAADLYIGVVALTQTGDRLGWDVPGTLVEYAVKMHQFPQGNLLSDLFDRGHLTPEHLTTLAKIVADFHRNAATHPSIRAFGDPQRIRSALEDNYRHTEKYLDGPQTRAQWAATRAFTEGFFREKSALLQERQAQDRIRECHGDLHLRNICLWRGQILPFDCIEFNESFRFVDVMYDLAFTVMDLAARRRPDLGNIFLNAYLEDSGDWEGLQVLPLYLCRQAYVRAKVTSFLLEDPGLDDAQHQQAWEDAAAYYRLAWDYTQPRQGQLILMSGLSGSGKSTTARWLAPQINAIYLRSDAIRKHLAGVPLYAKGDAHLYTAAMSEKTYGRLIDLGLLLAREGYTVILDAKFDRQVHRHRAIALAKEHHLPLRILHCTAPLATLRRRLEQRQGDIADATADLLEEQRAIAEPFTEQEQAWVTTLNTTLDLPKQLPLQDLQGWPSSSAFP